MCVKEGIFFQSKTHWFVRKCVRISIICSIPYGKSALKWGAWAKKDRSNAQVLKQNVRKRLKTFENVWKYSKNDVKRSKIFENIRLFFYPPAHLIDLTPLAAGALFKRREINQKLEALHRTPNGGSKFECSKSPCLRRAGAGEIQNKIHLPNARCPQGKLAEAVMRWWRKVY